MTATVEVSAKVTSPDEGVSAEEHIVTVEIPETTDEAVELYGEEVTYQQFKAALVVSLQGYIRGLIKQKKSADEIQKLATEWKPGLRARGKSPQEKLMEQWQKLSPDERSRLMETFMSSQGEAA
jgi:hypothetical protein